MKTKVAKGATREHILGVADSLFYHNGIRAVGVDTIVAQAGIAKTTLYDHFASKEDLINAYLEGRDSYFWQEVEAALAQHPNDPKQQFMDLFEGFEALIASEDFLGCPFLSAAAEFPELDQPGHRVALKHKQKMRSRFQEVVQAVGVEASEQLADQLLLLLDGAFASKRVFRSENSPALQLKVTANMLLELHLASNEERANS